MPHDSFFYRKIGWFRAHYDSPLKVKWSFFFKTDFAFCSTFSGARSKVLIFAPAECSQRTLKLSLQLSCRQGKTSQVLALIRLSLFEYHLFTKINVRDSPQPCSSLKIDATVFRQAGQEKNVSTVYICCL